jgi:hypothetical protein
MDPHAKRDADERRLTGLRAGVVGLAVAGIGVFAGLAAAITYALCAATVIGLLIPHMLIGRGGGTAPDARRARSAHS